MNQDARAAAAVAALQEWAALLMEAAADLMEEAVHQE